MYNLVDAANATVNYEAGIENELNLEQWMLEFAFHRCVGNDDVYGIYTGHNVYLFQPVGQKWVFMPWDLDRVFRLGPSHQLSAVNDSLFSLTSQWEPQVWQMLQTAQLQRAYWRGLKRAAEALLIAGGSTGFVNQNYDALVAKGVWAGGSLPTTQLALVNNYISSPNITQGRGSYVLDQYNNKSATFAITSNNGQNFTTTVSPYPLMGTAPFSVTRITLSNNTSPEEDKTVTWSFFDSTSPFQRPVVWIISVELANGANELVVRSYDASNNLVAIDTITITK